MFLSLLLSDISNISVLKCPKATIYSIYVFICNGLLHLLHNIIKPCLCFQWQIKHTVPYKQLLIWQWQRIYCTAFALRVMHHHHQAESFLNHPFSSRVYKEWCTGQRKWLRGLLTFSLVLSGICKSPPQPLPWHIGTDW